MNKVLVNEELEKRKFLVDLLKKSRKEYPNSISFIDSLITKLEIDPEFHQKFVTEVSTIFKDINFVRYLTTSGLMQENSIFSLLRFKIMNIVLPEIDNSGTLTSIINEIFYDAKTFKWFRIIPKDRWERFFTVFFQNFDDTAKNQIIKKIKDQLIESLDILMDKVGGGFSDDEMLRYRPEGNYHEIPFNELSKEIHSIIYNPEKPYDQLAIRQIIRSSSDYLDDILMQRDEKGISLKITMKIKRVIEELTRTQAVLRNFTELKSENGLVNFFTNATNSWPEYYSPRNWISKQISSNVYLITFLATYHNGKTGEHYITSTKKEYNKMFMTAVGGGLIVAICCYVKAWMHNMETISLFTETFLYCINYAVGFAAIYLTHMTLATKQPSMTASLIAHTLVKEEGKKEIDFSEFSKLFTRLSRSQFIAFQGNVVGSFALCLIIFYIFKFTVGTQVFTVTDAQQFWEELAYFYPKILWFASIAGFFLFLSGLLSGLVINDQRYHNITERIYLHPFLSRFFKQEKRRKIADWFDRNMGGVIGNVAFGFMMGSAFLVGKFLNIDFDIRHITFVAGNLAMGLAGLNFTGVTIKLLLVAIIAMFSVGAFNFLVSFSLSLILAMRSNKIKLRNIFPMAGSVIKAFFRNPVLFFFPPKNAPAVTNGGLME